MDYQSLHRLIKANNVQSFYRPEHSDVLLAIQSKQGDCALHLACHYDREEILGVLVTVHSADVEVSNHEGKKPLHEAAQFSSLKCLNYLLSKGVQVDSLKRADWTPLMLACTRSKVDVVQALLAAGANPCLKNKDGWNSFHIACREGHIPILQELVNNSPMVWDTKSKNSRTPLHTAALHGHAELVSWLLKTFQYDIDAADSCGVTALVDALRSGHVDIASTLVLDYKADTSSHDKVGRQPIHQVAQTGQQNSLEFLLDIVKVPVDTASEITQETALHTSAKEGQELIMEILIKHGADVNKTDSRGRTALHIASGAQSASCVRSLLYHGALMLSDNSGKLPNELAIKKSVIDVFASIVK